MLIPLHKLSHYLVDATWSRMAARWMGGASPNLGQKRRPGLGRNGAPPTLTPTVTSTMASQLNTQGPGRPGQTADDSTSK